jgi:hypothetical protein
MMKLTELQADKSVLTPVFGPVRTRAFYFGFSVLFENSATARLISEQPKRQARAKQPNRRTEGDEGVVTVTSGWEGASTLDPRRAIRI